MNLAAQVIDLQKHYDLGSVVVKALRGVSIDFPYGDFVAIMGSSGSGEKHPVESAGRFGSTNAWGIHHWRYACVVHFR